MSKQTGFSFASSKKSLIETIDEIKKSKMPRNEKIVALKACGLREKEISDMLKVLYLAVLLQRDLFIHSVLRLNVFMPSAMP